MIYLRGDNSGCHQRLVAGLAELRSVEGCPVGDDERLLQVALAPEYTPCPNPFLGEFVTDNSPETPFIAAPFAADISEGRGDPIYKAQIYHTKVPPRAISRYIEHFTNPGDIVFDGFCGSGMTGVAARLTGRRALLADLSPAATALAAGYCLPVDPQAVQEAFAQVLSRLREECDWLYRLPNGLETDYVVWSEVYRCPYCDHVAPFADFGFDLAARRPTPRIVCPECSCPIGRRRLQRVLEESGVTREMPLRVRYTPASLRAAGLWERHKRRKADVADDEDAGATAEEAAEFEAGPEDLAILDRIASQQIPYWYPDNWMMNRETTTEGWGDMWRRGYHTGVRKVEDFYFRRSLWALAGALQFAQELEAPARVRHLVYQTILNVSIGFTRMRRAYQGPVPLVLYFPRMRREVNVIRTLERRFRSAGRMLQRLETDCARCSSSHLYDVRISTQSGTSLPNIPDSCVDYIFTDPPFGQNILYSEVNFLWESWLGICTAQEAEAVVSRRQRKTVGDYQALLQACFSEFRRILKPGRWITVEFHNSQNEVWAAIQQALKDAGFLVVDVRILDKRQPSFKQASTLNAVQKDLVISALKPFDLEEGIGAASGAESEGTSGYDDEEAVWRFVEARLRELRGDPGNSVAAAGLGEATPLTDQERTARMLFVRVLQHWVAHGWRPPLSAEAFYEGLRKRFLQDQGLYQPPADSE